MSAGQAGAGREVAPSLPALACIAALLIAWGVAAVHIGVPAFEARHAVLVLATGSLAGVCGLVTWQQVPRSRIGPLLVITAAAWYIGLFRWLTYEPLADAAAALSLAYAAIAAHGVLTAPLGRVDGWTLRGLVAAAYLAAVMPVPRTDLLVAAVLLVGIGWVAWRDRSLRGGIERDRAPALLAGAAFAVVLGSSWLLPSLAVLPGRLDVRPLLQASLVLLALALAIPLVRDRHRASHVREVVLELGANRRPDLAKELGALLGDPNLRLGFWHRPQRRYVDAEGRPVELPTADMDEVATLIDEGGAPMAVLVHAADASLDPSLGAAVAHAARIAMANAHLQAAVRAQVIDLRASRRRLLAARDSEHLEIERRLEVGLGPRLAALRAALEDPVLRDAHVVAGVLDQIDQTHRDVVRLSHGIAPLLDDLGLAGALAELAARAPVPVDLEIRNADVPSRASRTAILFVAGEALANVVKHALPCRVMVRLSREDDDVRIDVADDGRGGADVSRGSGLLGLQDRVEALGGRLLIESRAGAGTRLTAVLPLEDPPW